MLVHYKKMKVCKTDEIKCPERNCNYSCNNKTDLKGHINSRHIHFRVIECDLCNEWFYTQKAAHTHKRCRHPDSLPVSTKPRRESFSDDRDDEDDEEDTRSIESGDSLPKPRAFSVEEGHTPESDLQKASSADDFSWDSDQSDLQLSAVGVLLKFQNPDQGILSSAAVAGAGASSMAPYFPLISQFAIPLDSTVPQGSAFPPIVGGKPLTFEDESLRFVEMDSEYEGAFSLETQPHKPSRLMISGILNPDLKVAAESRPMAIPRRNIPSPGSLKARGWKWNS